MRFARLTRRDLRLASGLTLFAYVAAHLTNHALGLISLASAQRGLDIAVRVWQSLPGTLLLYGAAAVHPTLAFAAIYARRTLRMPTVELIRILLGLGIPLLLIGHAIATRIAYELYDASPDYTRVVWALWSSDNEGRQLALLVPGWLHGCLGVYIAFGHRRTFQRLRFVLFAGAVLLPVLAGLGFLAMGKELAMQATNRAWLDAHPATDPAQRIALIRLRDTGLGIYLAAIAAVFAAREIRALVERQRGALIAVTYPQRTVHVPRGWSVLEASRSFHIAHTSVCGGRARCSTCRVRVVDGHDHCPPPDPATRRCFRDTAGGRRTRRTEARSSAAWHGARGRSSLCRLAQPGVVQRTAFAAGRSLSRESIHRSDRQRGAGDGKRRLRCRHGKRDRHLRAPRRRR